MLLIDLLLQGYFQLIYPRLALILGCLFSLEVIEMFALPDLSTPFPDWVSSIFEGWIDAVLCKEKIGRSS